ncbi:methyl-accepting chemotaxis protein [Thalassorhabdus alkalitolerans]|uniref:Methyl-accepting chemotaxis protein n=1 Tax=Thalassorhabdus alkalitolerans TaxID=2282697 RepID=A0ABW0YLP4_9BACI
MKAWKFSSVKAKLLGVFFSVIFIFLLGFSYIYWNQTGIETETMELEHMTDLTFAVEDIEAFFSVQYIELSEQVRAGEMNEERYQEAEAALNESLSYIENNYRNSQQQAFLEELTRYNEEFGLMADSILSGAASNENQILNQLYGVANIAIDRAESFSDLVMVDHQSAEDRLLSLIGEAKFSIFLTFVVATSVGTVLFLLFSIKVSKALKQAVVMANEISQGNLKTEKIEVTTRDEIGSLAASMNEMKENLTTLVGQISSTSTEVAASAEQLTASTEETTRATDEISSSIQQIAGGTEAQLKSATQSSAIITDISKGMERITTNIQDVNSTTQETADRAEKGTEVLHQTISQMTTIEETTSSTSSYVQELGQKSKEIGEIISLINAVSDQTNLLALNAAIEAARAGEHGKGFAVVADEVRKLAEQSGSSAKQINQIIRDIQAGIENSVKSMTEGKIAVKEGMTLVGEAGLSFEEIMKAVQNISRQVEDVTSAVEEVRAGTESVVQTISETTRISNDSSSFSQNVAAAAEEQSASMEEISDATTTLASMAEDLQKSATTFKV